MSGATGDPLPGAGMPSGRRARPLVRPPAPVGVAGLGVMGTSIARLLLVAGYRVVAYDVRPEAVAAAEALGATACGSAATLAAEAEVVVSSLPSNSALESVVGGWRRAPGRLTEVIEASTLAVEDKQRAASVLAEADISLLDCPISGTGAQMRHGDVVTYASGETDSLERCRPVLDAYSRRVLMVGGLGNGSRLKLVANHLVAVHNVAAAEAVALATRAGLDPRLALEALVQGAGTSRMLEVRGPMMVDRSYQPATMRVALFGKDLQLIASLAKQCGATTPLLDASASIYSRALAQGHEADDTASVLEVLLPSAPG